MKEGLVNRLGRAGRRVKIKMTLEFGAGGARE
jgi:hypothetical protein